MVHDELKLLGTWGSPFALRVQLALSFKGLRYENVGEDLTNKSELLLTSNPVHKKIPVLIHNGKPVCDSKIIVQYIDEAFTGAGPALLPTDPYGRAIARFWAAYIDDKLLASWFQWFREKTEEGKAERLNQTLAAVEHVEAAFKECSKGKPFFGGDNVGYLDVTLGCVVSWGLVDAARSPHLNAWMERFGALDAAKAVLPDADRLLDYAKMRKAQNYSLKQLNLVIIRLPQQSYFSRKKL